VSVLQESNDTSACNSVPSTELQAPTSKEMAKSAGVSVSTIEHAKAAQKAGLSKAVIDGTITAKAAANKGKPAKPPTPPPVVDEADVYTEADKLKDANSELVDTIETLRIQIATATYTGEEQSLPQVVLELQAECKMLRINLKAVTISRDWLMNEANAMKKYIAMQKKQIKDLTK